MEAVAGCPVGLPGLLEPGVRSFLKDDEAQMEELKDEWMQMMKDKYGAKVTEDSAQEGPQEPHRGRGEEGEHEREE